MDKNTNYLGAVGLKISKEVLISFGLEKLLFPVQQSRSCKSWGQ